MPSSTSHSSSHKNQLVKALSSSSHKHSSKDSNKSNTKLIKAPEPDIYHRENKSLWKDVKKTQGNPSTLILAVVAPEQRKPMKKIIDEKIKKKKIRSSVIVTTQEQLQEHLHSSTAVVVKKPFTTLHLFVSSTVAHLTYHIGKFVDQVFVKPCRPEGRQDALQIGTDSTYCDFQSYAWDWRSSDIQLKQLMHHEGCMFDTRTIRDEAFKLLNQPRMHPDLSDDAKTNIIHQFEALGNERVSPSTREDSSTSANGTDTWFQKWKTLLATVIAAGAGGAGMAGGFWMSAGGIMVKGPWGLSVAAGYATVACGGTAIIAGAGSAIVGFGAVYFIPWDRVWKIFRAKLWNIWDMIWETLVWIKDKLVQLARTVMSNVSWFIQEAPMSSRLSM
ncbi:hypothetical protein F53441_1263 [Fusarium austroafricanum]|uniref:Uncharacterized protein n=1 Tax=Fusarium austroafricanum TaxID=2364996 RepID=A0A8H4PDK1_9HYPO|nr:hypothetical protein F53441_1263 [Fusarium austroafricanum]